MSDVVDPGKETNGGETTGVLDRVAAAFDAVEHFDDPAVFTEIADRKQALARLEASGGQDLPLAGLTFVVKNNIDVVGLTTTAACPSFGYLPETSAPVVDRLVDAGATCLGATNLDQFATGLVGTRSPFGVPRNAVDPRLVPGGSSSGSAVAVARGVADFALGTDTAGSGRVPAAQNRIMGIKPTKGRLPIRGVVPAVQSLDCVAIFARDLVTGGRVLDVATGYDPLDPWSRHRRPGPVVGSTVVVGVPSSVVTSHELDGKAWAASVEQLRATPGVEVQSFDLGPFISVGEMLYGGPWVAERYAAVGEFLATEPADADPTVAEIIRAATSYSALDAYRAEYRLAELRRATLAVWDDVDVVAMPTTPGVATLQEVAEAPVERNSELGRYTNFVNLLDLAAVAVPGVDRSDGWPFGVTFAGPAWSDELLVRVATAFGSVGADGSSHPHPTATPDFGTCDGVEVVVVGAHLRGQPLNWQLTDHGGRFVRATTTAPNYRLYRLAGDGVPKPALVRVSTDDSAARAVEVEVWRLPSTELGPFSRYIPAPLGLGRVTLADGSNPTGFIGEPAALDGAVDITHHGGWRAYLAAEVDLSN